MNTQITKYQLFNMVTNFIIFSSILMAPALTVTAAGQDGWISMLIAVFIGMLLNALYLFLLKKHQYPTLFSLIDRSVGKWIGTVLNVVLIFYAFHLGAMVVRNLSNFMVASVFPNAHPWTFQILILTICMFTVFYGMNNLFLVSELLSPVILLTVLVSVILMMKDFEFMEIKPILHTPLVNIYEGAYATLGFPFIESLLLGNFLHYVVVKKWVMTVHLTAIGCAGLVLTGSVLLITGNDGAYIVARETYPTYSVLRDIKLASFIERGEILIALGWLVGLFFKISICFLVVVSGFQHLSGSKNYQAFILPSAIFIWAMSNHLHKTVTDFTEFVTSSWTLYWLSLYCVLILVFIIGLFRTKLPPLPR
ncbi:GerAB/ArcD/ProY family transporter [Halobacillus litoralis]|uniref:GerAB/ArcD/ProY family transporter n=1 Tax=Halobacillus litoralis TaxID=45668 RepID=UPI001CD43913|nr:endospore germination permease [Halobacillus litoralis]MCA1021086.1 endospore germination permease [Halobacillus litoralis]